MSDINSSLPVRTQTNGDVVAFLADGTTPTQLLGIDASGRLTIKLDDGAGNVITSQANGAQRALDIGINVAGVQIDPRVIRALTATDVVTVQQGTSPWITKDQADGPVTPGTAAAFSELVGGQYNSALPTLTTAQQSAVQLDVNGRLLTKDSSDGSVTGGAAGTTSMLGGGVYTSATGLTTPLTAGQQAGLQFDANGRLLVDLVTSIPAGTNLIGGTTVYVGSSAASLTNPVPVVLTNTVAGTLVNDYNTVASVAANATSNHDYPVTATKVFTGRKFWASASGKLKIEVQISTNGTTFVSKWVGFNSTANPNITIDLDNLSITDTGTGAIVRVIRTNKDLLPMDVYSTISGSEA